MSQEEGSQHTLGTPLPRERLSAVRVSHEQMFWQPLRKQRTNADEDVDRKEPSPTVGI